jgi:hypothetical protein
LADAADALRNGSFVPGNAAYNYISGMLGHPAPTQFEAVKAAVVGELATALKGYATDQEIHTIAANIQQAASPEHMKGAVDNNLHLIGTKLNTYHEAYHQLIKDKDNVWSPILPSARSVFQKHGFDPTAGPMAQPNPQQPKADLRRQQQNRKTGAFQHSLDGGITWQPGPLQQ